MYTFNKIGPHLVTFECMTQWLARVRTNSWFDCSTINSKNYQAVSKIYQRSFCILHFLNEYQYSINNKVQCLLQKSKRKVFLIFHEMITFLNGTAQAREALEFSPLVFYYTKFLLKVRISLLWHVDHFLVWGFFKFITTKEPKSGNYRHIFSRDDHIFPRNNRPEKIYAYNFRCWALLLW